MKAELFIQSDNILGEGPVWDAKQNELLWVDIERKLLCFCNVNTGDVSNIELDSRIGTAVPTAHSAEYLLALQSGLKIYNRKTCKYQLISDPEKDINNNRFNDGKCDPMGRFWIGTMDINAKPAKGNLYCLDQDLNISKKLQNLSISNGMAWSIDHRKMYFIDTATHKVVCFDYDSVTGNIENSHIVIHVPHSHGAPDGMCIDSEGMLWIAHWGGGNVSRWNPFTGELLQKVDVPAPHVTSCCFGGENLDTLFITTAKSGMSEELLKQYPYSGSIFSITPGIKGYLPSYFKTN
jgi:sugar lactone lactonase YvrE